MKEEKKYFSINNTHFTRWQLMGAYWLIGLTVIAFTISWWSFIPDPNESDLSVTYLPPFHSSSHLLGTDQLGRDLLSHLLNGIKTAWLLTFPPLFVSTLLGVGLGSVAALQGNKGFRCSYGALLSTLFGLSLFLYVLLLGQWWEFPILRYDFTPASGKCITFIVAAFLSYLIWRTLLNFKSFRKTISLPFDELLLKAIDIWSTLPKLLLLLLLSAFSSPSLFSLGAWIAVSYWVFPARLTRTRILQLKQEVFVEAARTLGIPTKRVLTHHIWPSLAGPLIVDFCFSASGLLGVGSTLAFLGIGVPADIPSWGKLLSTSRYHLEAWWLFSFPALILLLSILSLQALGQSLIKRD